MAIQLFKSLDGLVFDSEAEADAHDATTASAREFQAWCVKYLANTGRFKNMVRMQNEARNLVDFVTAYESYKTDGDLLEMPEFTTPEPAEEQQELPTDEAPPAEPTPETEAPEEDAGFKTRRKRAAKK